MPKRMIIIIPKAESAVSLFSLAWNQVLIGVWNKFEGQILFLERDYLTQFLPLIQGVNRVQSGDSVIEACILHVSHIKAGRALIVPSQASSWLF